MVDSGFEQYSNYSNYSGFDLGFYGAGVESGVGGGGGGGWGGGGGSWWPGGGGVAFLSLLIAPEKEEAAYQLQSAVLITTAAWYYGGILYLNGGIPMLGMPSSATPPLKATKAALVALELAELEACDAELLAAAQNVSQIAYALELYENITAMAEEARKLARVAEVPIEPPIWSPSSLRRWLLLVRIGSTIVPSCGT